MSLLFACGTGASDNPPAPPGSGLSYNPPAPPDTINVKSGPYNAKGDGVTNDLEAIKAALAVSKNVIFPEGTYYLGDVGSATPNYGILFVVDGGAQQHGGEGAIYFQTVGKVRFVVNTVDPSVPTIFRFLNASSVYFGPHVEFEDTGYDPNITWKGAAGINLFADVNAGPLTNVSLPSIKARSMVQAVVLNGGTQEKTRVSHVNIGVIDCTEVCFYGVNAQNNGDDVNVDLLKTYQAVRSYFVYGVTGHRANVFSTAMRTATGDIDIASFYYGLDTSDIKIKYTAREAAHAGTLCSIQTVGKAERISKVSNVEFDVDVDGSGPIGGIICDWKDYPTDGLAVTQNTGASANQATDIRLKGHIDNTNAYYHFYTLHQPAVFGKLYIEGDFDLEHIPLAVRQYWNITRVWDP